MKVSFSAREWNNYWNRRTEEKTLSTGGRMAGQLCDVLPVQDRLVLEMGAGLGTDGLSLMKQGARVVFVDFALSPLTRIKNQKLNSPFPLMAVCADVEHLPFRDAVFDAVIHQGLMEHFPDPGPMLSESRRILKIGGISVADAPQRFHPYTLFKHVWMEFGLWVMGWETEYSPRQLVGILRRNGFAVQKIYGAWSRPSLLYRLVRELLRPFCVRLPLRPARLPFFSGVRDRLATWLLGQKWTFWTVMDIGVLARKPDHVE